MAGAAASEPEADRELIVTRSFDAPARLLFEAWSRPEHLKRWFGPVGYPVTMCEMDFRVGGQWRAAMTGPGGQQQTPFGGAYLEIVPDRRIVFSNGFELPGAEKMVMTVTFDEKNGRTLLTIRTLFASIAQRATHVGAGMAEGLGSGLDQLADLAAEMKKQAA
ncbi:SRPBCC family protein [Reyranella sp.]|uniref:SRPBCC family protein n=1 Tax=Reyranella sp. TaxID=1929291 RepID=UPI003BAAE3D1